jgi:hypothetical protein
VTEGLWYDDASLEMTEREREAAARVSDLVADDFPCCCVRPEEH